MADEKDDGGNPWEFIFIFFGIIALLVALALMNGNLKPGSGMLLSPPPPLGNGNSYNPYTGTSTASTTSAVPSSNAYPSIPTNNPQTLPGSQQYQSTNNNYPTNSNY